MDKIIIVRHWEMLPSVVYDGDIAYSTRVLERQHRLMRAALITIKRRYGHDFYAIKTIVDKALEDSNE